MQLTLQELLKFITLSDKPQFAQREHYRAKKRNDIHHTGHTLPVGAFPQTEI